MDDQTTLAQPESIRDALTSAIESNETVNVEENATEQPLKQEEAAAESNKTTRPRDGSGRFAKADKIANTEVSEETEEEPQEQPQVRSRPSSWKKDYEEDWGKIDPRVQEYILQREADFAKGVSTYKNQWDTAAPIMDAIGQFAPILQQNNVDPAQWITNLGTAHQTLVYGSPEQKLQMFAQLANDYGVNLSALTGEQGYDPQFSTLASELSQIKNQWQQFQQMQEKQEQTMLQSEIEEFKQGKPYFEDVRETMAGLLQSGVANDLQDAYDKAIRLNDGVFQQVQAEQAKKAEADRQAKLAEARAKALSPKSTTPTASTSSGGKGNSLRDALAESLDKFSTSSI